MEKLESFELPGEVLEAWHYGKVPDTFGWMFDTGLFEILIFEGLQCWLLGIHRWGRTSCAPFSWKLHLDFIRLIGRHGDIGIAYGITYQGQCHGRKISSGTFQRHLAKTASDEKNIKMKLDHSAGSMCPESPQICKIQGHTKSISVLLNLSDSKVLSFTSMKSFARKSYLTWKSPSISMLSGAFLSTGAT